MSDLSSESDIESSNEGSFHDSSGGEVEELECVKSESSDDEDQPNRTTQSTGARGRRQHGVDRDQIEPYADEPVPDNAWLQEYTKRREKWLEDMDILIKRLQNRVNISEW